LETLLSDLDTPSGESVMAPRALWAGLDCSELELIRPGSGSVQELVLVALLAVCAATPALAQSEEVVARLKGKKADRSAYLQKVRRRDWW
jgi:hypothetical protein